MEVVFLETLRFTQVVRDYFSSDEAYRAFQTFLMQNPTAGAVMRGCGGLRKVRWIDAGRGKGKRSGLRIIYMSVPEAERIAFLDVYDKDEADDLTAMQREQLAVIAQTIRSEMLKRRKCHEKKR